jgi:membrane protease YdiL (CAAX protease family)
MSITWAIIGTSLLFAAAHYRLDFAVGTFAFQTGIGEVFEWHSFVFRTLAGAFFSLVFFYRGFGIAAGAHAMYDILVCVL